MTACNVSRDCANVPGNDWCVLGHVCALVRNECVSVPRCQSPPFLACSSAAQRCISIIDTDEAPNIFLMVIAPPLIVLVLAFLVFMTWRRQH